MGQGTPSEGAGTTRRGLLLLIVGAGLAWVPVCGSGLVVVLGVAGAVQILIGRKAFGPTHARNVVLAVIVYTVGVVAGGVVFLVGIVALIAERGASGPFNVAIYIDTLFWGTVIGSVTIGIAWTILPMALVGSLGRGLLWTGLVANFIVTLAVAVAVSDAITAAIVSGGSTVSLGLGVFLVLSPLWVVASAVPYALWAGGYFLAYRQVGEGPLPGTSPDRTEPLPFRSLR